MEPEYWTFHAFDVPSICFRNLVIGFYDRRGCERHDGAGKEAEGGKEFHFDVRQDFLRMSQDNNVNVE